MSVGILIITHNDIGKQLLNTAEIMLGTCPLQVAALSITVKCDPDNLANRAEEMIGKLNEGDGVLVLTDMYGSTPSNIANRLLATPMVKVITGVNLPMLIRVLNYPRLNLDQLSEKAQSGGRDGVMLCRTHPDT